MTIRLPFLFLALLFLASACAGVQFYPTGVPASAGEKFFIHLEEEALDRGFTVRWHDTLLVDVDAGQLKYQVIEDEISVVITVQGAIHLTKDEVASKRTKLKALSDDLVENARQRAEAPNAFE